MEPDGSYEVYQYCKPDEDNESDGIIPGSRNTIEVVSVSFEDGKAVINYICPVSINSSGFGLDISDISLAGKFSFSADVFLIGDNNLFSDAAYRRIPLWRRNYFLREKFFYLF